MEKPGKRLKNPEGRRLYEFGPFFADPQKRILLKDGEPVAITGKPFDILVALLEAHGELLTKDELASRLWPDTVVEEGNLWRNVSSLRKALGETPSQPYIVTQARRGYRFVADVRERVEDSAESPPALQPPAPEPRTRRWGIAAWFLAALALVLATAGFYGRRFFQPNARGALHSLAVLPLANLSGDPAQDYLADGITEELITEMAAIEPLHVTSRTSVMQYKGVRKPIRQIAQELKVDALLEGSITRHDNHVHITAQLIRAATDTHLWARTYDGDLADVLSFEHQVAAAIAREVAVKLEPEGVSRVRPPNSAAYELYLKGRYAWNQRSFDELIQAVRYFQQATALDPGYAQAYAGLADALDLRALDSPRTAGALGLLAEAKRAAVHAIQIDSTLAEAHTSLAGAKILADWDWAGAEQEFRRALMLNPRYAPAHHWLAVFLLAPQGRTDEALAEMHRVLELDPLSLIYNTDLGWTYFAACQYEHAAKQLRQVLEMEPAFLPAIFRLERTYEAMGKFPQAMALQIENESRLHTGLASVFAQAYRRSGYRGVWRARLQVALRRKTPGDSEFERAQLYSALGDKANALTELQAGVAHHAPALIFVKTDPVFDPLRTAPAFQEIEAQIGLPPDRPIR